MQQCRNFWQEIPERALKGVSILVMDRLSAAPAQRGNSFRHPICDQLAWIGVRKGYICTGKVGGSIKARYSVPK